MPSPSAGLATPLNFVRPALPRASIATLLYAATHGYLRLVHRSGAPDLRPPPRHPPVRPRRRLASQEDCAAPPAPTRRAFDLYFDSSAMSIPAPGAFSFIAARPSEGALISVSASAEFGLLSLPDEVLQRVFELVTTPPHAQRARSRTPVPASYLLVCRRLFPVVEKVFLSSIMLDIDSSDARLADLSWRPKTVTRHVEDISVQNRSSLAPLHFVALAGLVDLRVLRLPDRGASSHCPMRYGADTERLLHSLKKLHTLSLSGFWSVPPQTLPDWVVRLNILANMLHDATALDLSTTRLRRLHLFFDGRETHLSALPWHTLEHLSVRSISSNLELPFAMLGQQVRLHARVVIVSQTEGRNSRNAPLLKQTNGGLQAGQLRALVLDLKREGRSGPLDPLLEQLSS